MAVNKLLVAFDESEGADRALAMAASLAAVNPEAHVDVVYVVPIPLLDETQMANFKDILDMMISDGEDLLAEAEQKMGEDVAARTDSLLLTGTNPATEIVKLIGQRDYDLLIVGNRGLSGLKEYMGSVSPVSYTHLDVYKRQRKGRAGRCCGSARNASRPFRCASAISRSFVAARMSAKYASRARSNDPGSASNPAFAR